MREISFAGSQTKTKTPRNAPEAGRRGRGRGRDSREEEE